jgi:hypothetical protein
VEFAGVFGASPVSLGCPGQLSRTSGSSRVHSILAFDLGALHPGLPHTLGRRTLSNLMVLVLHVLQHYLRRITGSSRKSDLANGSPIIVSRPVFTQEIGD